MFNVIKVKVSNFLTYKLRTRQIMELDYKIQTYAWGKKGSQSKVAVLHANNNKNFKIEENTPYAELWMGTHVNGPSTLKNGQLLSNFIAQHPESLGEKVQKVFGNQLPFLFKVLSVNQALSIQAHPSKQHAEVLHKQHPDIYKNPNHKPEMAIALTEFEVLCGFRPISEICSFFKNVPELKTVAGDVSNDAQSETIDFVKAAFKAILTAPKNVVSEQLNNLIKRLKTLDQQQRQFYLAELLENLYHYYPDDAGCFMVYFLNYIKLQPFQAIFLGPNEPHCYLSGDCIECMACSDNVVRAGLTPKYVDVETLCSMLIYKGEEPEQKLFKSAVEDDYSQIFKPPVPDFAIVQIKVPASLESFTLKQRSSASILLVINGDATLDDISLTPGTAVFIPANRNFTISNISKDLLLYQSVANI